MKFLIMQLSPPSPFNFLSYSGPSTTGQIKGLTCLEIIHSVYFSTIFFNPTNAFSIYTIIQFYKSSYIFCCNSTILRELTVEAGYIQLLQI